MTSTALPDVGSAMLIRALKNQGRVSPWRPRSRNKSGYHTLPIRTPRIGSGVERPESRSAEQVGVFLAKIRLAKFCSPRPSCGSAVQDTGRDRRSSFGRNVNLPTPSAQPHAILVPFHLRCATWYAWTPSSTSILASIVAQQPCISQVALYVSPFVCFVASSFCDPARAVVCPRKLAFPRCLHLRRTRKAMASAS
jgi:hypothetical protein